MVTSELPLLDLVKVDENVSPFELNGTLAGVGPVPAPDAEKDMVRPWAFVALPEIETTSASCRLLSVIVSFVAEPLLVRVNVELVWGAVEQFRVPRSAAFATDVAKA
jgi:hypothetical protein